MGQLLIRNVDDETIAQVKARAAANGRSMEAELREMIRAGLAQKTIADRWTEFRRLADISRALTANRSPGAATSEQLLRESRDER
jgi:plasmid stability protein